MRCALELAKKTQASGEVPVGAVLVKNGEIIGEGANCPITEHDPSAHAEIRALREAGRSLGNYRLTGTTLYVTLEPCLMCAGALIHSRIERLVFGACDPKAGAVVSRYAALDLPYLNHCVDYEDGVLAKECGDLITSFFQSRRSG